MENVKVTEGDLHPRDARFAIVASRFNEFVVNALLKGALACLDRHGDRVGEEGAAALDRGLKR